MTKDQLITKQQILIEEYKEIFKRNEKLRKTLRGNFYSIGAPLNDNILKMNKEQLIWCLKVVGLVEQLNGL